MKRILSIFLIAIAVLTSISAAIIVPDTASTSFTIMSNDPYNNDYVVDRTTWTVRRNGFKIDQMEDNIWTLEDSYGTTIVAVNADEKDLSDVIYLYYRNKSVNLIAYNTPISLSTIRSISKLRSAYISNMDNSVALYLASQKNIPFRGITEFTALSIENGIVSPVRTSSENRYAIITCPDCGSKIYVNLADYI